MAVVVALNRKRGNLKGQLTKLLNAITDEETMDIPQLEAQLELLKKVQEKYDDLKEDYYKSASDEEYLTIEASLSEIDQEIQHLEPLQKGGMHLHKWCCSRTSIRESQTFPLDRNSEEITVKTLGMLWESSADTFSKVTVSTNSSFTKRDVLRYRPYLRPAGSIYHQGKDIYATIVAVKNRLA
ncbi:hypothetical protein NPIL_247331 [Nephila pilipes]|uniref:Uncharacterized protein n=1 Tax=Nephila pilipes TaxID=299642 RepID=A0A8X6UMM3_NEPPI|nr:hypothetical protein NPIL_247331 [Nephila pilipes]